MPTKSKKTPECTHDTLFLDPSPHAADVGFNRPSKRQRTAAATGTTPSNKLMTGEAQFADPETFPGPLVLPDDDLAIYPDWPPQPVKEWQDGEWRNPVTAERRTLYVIPSPTVSDEMNAMKAWRVPVPVSRGKKKGRKRVAQVKFPETEHLRRYLEAFYHGMTVHTSSSQLEWRPWHHETPKNRNQNTITPQPAYDGTPLVEDKEEHVGLLTPSGSVFRIRCRPSPDGVSCMQVNLDDVLDAVGSAIPSDAYGVVMAMQEDMWEGDGDIFTGGRAYGASRIAVVSAFRDHPDCATIDDGHSWPFSHCVSYVNSHYPTTPDEKPDKRIKTQHDEANTPLRAAITAASQIPTPARSLASKYARWLANTAQTMAHELGHCFGLDHCVYFACSMQGCASSAEAVRQPPYLCPVCLEKIAGAVGQGLIAGWDRSLEVREKYVRARREALVRVCGDWEGVKDGATMFAGFGGWLKAMLA